MRIYGNQGLDHVEHVLLYYYKIIYVIIEFNILPILFKHNYF
jgi:hypothetical protein